MGDGAGATAGAVIAGCDSPSCAKPVETQIARNISANDSGAIVLSYLQWSWDIQRDIAGVLLLYQTYVPSGTDPVPVAF